MNRWGLACGPQAPRGGTGQAWTSAFTGDRGQGHRRERGVCGPWARKAPLARTPTGKELTGGKGHKMRKQRKPVWLSE